MAAGEDCRSRLAAVRRLVDEGKPEITGGVIRVFRRNDAQHGDPFDHVVAFIGDEGVATLKGLAAGDARLPLGVIQAVQEELRRHGFPCRPLVAEAPNGTKLREFQMSLGARGGRCVTMGPARRAHGQGAVAQTSSWHSARAPRWG